MAIVGGRILDTIMAEDRIVVQTWLEENPTYVLTGEVRFYNSNSRLNDATNVFQDLQYGGGTRVWPTATSVVSIVSSSADDNVAGGSGAQVLQVAGLDTNGLRLTEIVLLTGTTPVVTIATFSRVNLITAVVSGAGRTNAGTITASMNGDQQGIIPPGFSVGQDFAFSVPSDFVAIVSRFTFWWSQSQVGELRCYVRSPTTDYTAVDIPVTSAASGSTINPSAILPPGSDTGCQFQRDTGNGGDFSMGLTSHQYGVSLVP